MKHITSVCFNTTISTSTFETCTPRTETVTGCDVTDSKTTTTLSSSSASSMVAAPAMTYFYHPAEPTGDAGDETLAAIIMSKLQAANRLPVISNSTSAPPAPNMTYFHHPAEPTDSDGMSPLAEAVLSKLKAESRLPVIPPSAATNTTSHSEPVTLESTTLATSTSRSSLSGNGTGASINSGCLLAKRSASTTLVSTEFVTSGPTPTVTHYSTSPTFTQLSRSRSRSLVDWRAGCACGDMDDCVNSKRNRGLCALAMTLGGVGSAGAGAGGHRMDAACDAVSSPSPARQARRSVAVVQRTVRSTCLVHVRR